MGTFRLFVLYSAADRAEVVHAAFAYSATAITDDTVAVRAGVGVLCGFLTTDAIVKGQIARKPLYRVYCGRV